MSISSNRSRYNQTQQIAASLAVKTDRGLCVLRADESSAATRSSSSLSTSLIFPSDHQRATQVVLPPGVHHRCAPPRSCLPRPVPPLPAHVPNSTLVPF
uniref:Uncharacterized protein n=1 Tax=Arundo donax TaxID=35708 RepID=A0A0A9A7F2_ARUDO